MIIKKLNPDLAMLLLRVGVGIIFIAHGIQKFQNLEGTVGFFGSLGLPAFMAYLIAAIETLAGLAVLMGALTDIAGILLAAVMVGAILLVKLKMGLLGGYELDLILLLAALAIAFHGPGRYALKKPAPEPM